MSELRWEAWAAILKSRKGFRSWRRPLWGIPLSCVYELVRAFGQFARNWADTPIQNGQLRRCGGGLEDVLLQRISSVRTEKIMGLAYRLGHLWPLSMTAESSPVPPGLRCVCFAQMQLGWPTPCSRPFFLYSAVRACYACQRQHWLVYCKPEELSREERLLSRPTGRSHNDDIGSAT
jgi:hypothetical protein